MSIQLIFVVEANKKSKSDWMYISDTIKRFYEHNSTHVKYSIVYMGGKGHYKEKESAILRLISQYSSQDSSRESKVIYCFDCDNYDTNAEDRDFLNSVRQYCDNKGYDFAWFCKDIEHVYWGEKVNSGDKSKKAKSFIEKNLINNIKPDRLTANNYKMKASNIMNVLDKYLIRK